MRWRGLLLARRRACRCSLLCHCPRKKRERLGARSLPTDLFEVLTNGFQALGGRAWKASLYMRSGRNASTSWPYTCWEEGNISNCTKRNLHTTCIRRTSGSLCILSSSRIMFSPPLIIHLPSPTIWSPLAVRINAGAVGYKRRVSRRHASRYGSLLMCSKVTGALPMTVSISSWSFVYACGFSRSA